MISGTRIDFWRESLNRRAFMGGSVVNAVVDQYTYLELWNPLASGVHLYCHKAYVNLLAEGSVNIGRHNAALANNGFDGNKYLNEAGPVGEVKTACDVGVLGTNLTTIRVVQTQDVIDSHPIIIPEGWGLLLRGYLVNVTLIGTFEWLEVDA